MVNALYNVIYTGLNQFVPVRKSPTSSTHSRIIYPHRLRKLLNRKCRLWSIYRRLRTPESLNKYKSTAAECRVTVYEFHVERENKIKNSGNVGKFFNYANRKFKCKSTIGPLKSDDGLLSIDPIHKTELLQSVFSSAYMQDNGYIPPLGTCTADHTKLSSIIFTPTLVKRVISRINGKAKGGPDDLPPALFKHCSNQLASPLAFIFNKCMENN
jgi:hypothetical protein